MVARSGDSWYGARSLAGTLAQTCTFFVSHSLHILCSFFADSGDATCTFFVSRLHVGRAVDILVLR